MMPERGDRPAEAAHVEMSRAVQVRRGLRSGGPWLWLTRIVLGAALCCERRQMRAVADWRCQSIRKKLSPMAPTTTSPVLSPMRTLIGTLGPESSTSGPSTARATPERGQGGAARDPRASGSRRAP